MKQRSEAEFRGFVIGFADPLARIAFLLTAGTNVDAADATTDALARVRDKWREAQPTGAPEALAIDALVASLPRRDRRRRERGPVPSADQGAVPHASGQDTEGDDGDDHDENTRIRMVLWESWRSLPARQRVPLVFQDPSVAGMRLVDMELPASVRSIRGIGWIEKRATAAMVAQFQTHPSMPASASSLTEQQLIGRLRDALREHAAAAFDPVDRFPLVERRAANLRRRSYAIAAAVSVLLAAGALTALHVSNSKPPPSTAPASPSTSSTNVAIAALPAAEQRTADPSLFAAAVLDAEAWKRTGGFPPSTTLVPLWGGIDLSSTRVAVLRLETAGPADGLAVDWYHDPGEAGSIDPNLDFSAHYLIPPGPLVPIAFTYATSQIGVVVPRGLVTATLVVDGHESTPIALDATGFASLRATSASGQAELGKLYVNVYDAANRLVQRLPVATPMPG